MMKSNLTDFAMHDPAHCLAPNLFKTFARNEKRGSLDVTYVANSGEKMQFTGFQQLSHFDLKVLQGVIAMAGKSSTIVNFANQIKSPLGYEMLSKIAPLHQARNERSKVVSTTGYRLLAEIGYKDDGPQRQQLLDSLKRLGNVTLYVEISKKIFWSCHLLGFGIHHEPGKNIDLYMIGLNTRISEMMIGLTHHAKIDMNEVRMIKGEAASILHQRLCGFIRFGETNSANLQTLIDYVWEPKCMPKDKDERNAYLCLNRKRRQRIKECIIEIESTNNWKFTEKQPGKYLIKRKEEKV